MVSELPCHHILTSMIFFFQAVLPKFQSVTQIFKEIYQMIQPPSQTSFDVGVQRFTMNLKFG